MHDSTRRVKTFVSVGSTLVLVAITAAAPATAAVVEDTFDAPDGNSAWHDVKGVTSTVGSGTGPMDGESVLVVETVVSVNLLARPFEPVTLANTGDSVTVSFDYQITRHFTAEGDYSPAFGLYHSNGTPIGGDGNDDPASTLDDHGYQASIRVAPGEAGTPVIARLVHESGQNDPHGPLAGTDILKTAESSEFPSVTTGDLRHYQLTLTRVEVGDKPVIRMNLTVTDPDGDVPAFTLESNVPPTRFTDTLDTFYLRSRSLSYELDNVRVE